MNPTPIDKLLAIDVLKDEVDEEYKRRKADAEDFLAEKRDELGVTGLSAPMFDGCGEFKYATTRAKKVVEFGVCDAEDLEDWVNANTYTAFLFIKENAEKFGKWCQDTTGEVPDGISRVEHEIPAGYGAPKFYRKDAEKVKEVLSGGGNLFEKVNGLLLGEGEGE